MNDFGHNLGPIVMFLFVLVALWRRVRKAAAPPSGPRTAAAPSPLPVAARPVRRRPAEPAPPPPRPRPTMAPAMGDMLSNEAAAAFPVLDLSLGDDAPAGAVVARRRVRRIAGGAPIGSRAWAASAIVAAEVLGTPVGLRAGATVGVPHAF